MWEIRSIKWGEGRLGPALGGRAECEVCAAPWWCCVQASRPGPQFSSPALKGNGVLIFCFFGFFLIFCFFYLVHHLPPLPVCVVIVSHLWFPCCLWLKKLCVHEEALQPRSQPV